MSTDPCSIAATLGGDNFCENLSPPFTSGRDWTRLLHLPVLLALCTPTLISHSIALIPSDGSIYYAFECQYICHSA